MIRAEQLCHTYEDGTEALKRVNVKVEKNERVALMGPNGAGKTTLILHFNGILKPTSGRVLFRGREIEYSRRYLSMLRRKVGVVFQNSDDQLFAPTVLEDVAFGLLNSGVPEEEARERALDMLERLGIRKLAGKAPHLLSLGQKKRVAIAGVLVMEPEVVIFDEPLSGLDPKGREEVEQILEELEATTVVATHDTELALSWADLVYVLNRGRVVAEGSPHDVFSDRKLLRECSLTLPTLAEVHSVFRPGILASPLEFALKVARGEYVRNNNKAEVTVACCTSEKLNGILAESDYIACSGIRAKVACHRLGFKPNAIARARERVLLHAWGGENAVLVAEHISREVKLLSKLAEKFNIKLEVRVVN